MSTAEKANSYKIQGRMHQAVFQEFVKQQGDDVFKFTVFEGLDGPMLSTIASVATRAVMKDPRLNVVLRKS